VVVSPDTDIAPVIAHSFNSDFSMEESDQNILLHLVTWDMSNRLKALPAVSQTVKDANSLLWDKYLSGSQPENSYLQIYGPLLPSPTWGQEAPYNNYCPVISQRRSYTGGVATAMAQIVNYWGYPSAVTFSPSDDYFTGYVVVIATTANFSAMTYPITSNGGKAALSYACGVAIHTMYGVCGLAAEPEDVPNALKTKFGYFSADWKTTGELNFYSTIQNNIRNGQPVQLSVMKHDGTNKHSLVADGYKTDTDQYHLNIGLDGFGDDWYSLPGMATPYEFDTLNGAIVNIAPAGGSEAPDLAITNASVSASALTASQAFTLYATVKNQGVIASAATTLRYFRSDDSSITTADTPLGTDSVGALQPEGTSTQNLSTAAPSSVGTWWVGACVDAVSGESQAGNQCSSGVQITVAPPPTVASLTPATGQNNASVSITDLAGTDFDSAPTVKLTRSGHADIAATNVVRVSATKLTCTLPISGAATGAWNVKVTNSDTRAGTLTGGFTVTGQAAEEAVRVKQGIFDPTQGKSSYVEVRTSSAGRVTVKVYDQAGRLVRTLYDGERDAGNYSDGWDGKTANGTTVASGTYLIRVEGPGIKTTRRVLVVK